VSPKVSLSISFIFLKEMEKTAEVAGGSDAHAPRPYPLVLASFTNHTRPPPLETPAQPSIKVPGRHVPSSSPDAELHSSFIHRFGRSSLLRWRQRNAAQPVEASV
jgi:hypothetical protein